MNCTKVKSWHVAESFKVATSKNQSFKVCYVQPQWQCTTGCLLESSSSQQPSLISGHWNVHQHWKFRATPETIKVLYKMQSVEAMMHTADKSVIQQRPWKWPKVQLDRSLEVNKVIQVVPVPKCSSIWFPVLPKWSKFNSDRCIKVALLHSESTLHLWYRDVESVK